MSSLPIQPAVVVGVDNSASAARHAAVWAIDEAVSRDIPLRLVHILEGEDSDPGGTAEQRLAAESAIHRAIRVFEATGKPVKLESEIYRGRAAGTLIRLSRQAAMVCLGAVGSNPHRHGQIGSTPAAVAGVAHCAVAIIHGAVPPTRAEATQILVATDEAPDDGVLLETAVREAALRDAPLRVITCWQPPHADPESTKEGDRRIRAQLHRRLARWRRTYPDVRVEPVAVHGNLSEYVTTHAGQLQMLIVSARGPGHVRAVVGPAGNATLSCADCTVLIVDHQHL
jgi:nucleotide-binding universal stress UspA family protein